VTTTLHRSGIFWDSKNKVGFYPVVANGTYDQSYFERYNSYRETEMGKAITGYRVGLVNKWCGQSKVLDVGIGCGQFIDARPGTHGYDVNPHGIRWLIDRGLWHDPHFINPDNATFWDSLEHIERPVELLERVKWHVFISTPIYRDLDHAASSKHFKPDEHFWYFTRNGLVSLMKSIGFNLLEESRVETELGREDIGTFAFRR
jgi:hypothetical protein